MQVYADPFVIPMGYVSPDYQLELIEVQSSDAMHVAFRYTVLLAVKNARLQLYLSIRVHNALVKTNMFEAPLEAQIK